MSFTFALRPGIVCLVTATTMALPLHADDLAVQGNILSTVDQVVRQGPYRPDFASLSRAQLPDWYRDAKFGIFLHWGVYSVPAWGTEWYPHYMYKPGTDEFVHQLSTYGPLTSFGYKDFIPLFTAAAFNPDAWMRLFRKSGAKFIVPVSEHHDGFSMWNNPLNPYNAVTMGPRRDVVGELAIAARKHGLAFGLSNHRAQHWWFYEFGKQGGGSDVQDPANADLYGPAMPDKSVPDDAFLENWLARTAASIDAYQPDLVYFDSGLGASVYQPYLQKLGAHLYNRAGEWNKDIALTVKDGYPAGAAVNDVELGTVAGIGASVWQADTSVAEGSWGYTTNAIYKDPGLLVRELADDVSKNGVLLLNLGPKADGSIAPEQQQILQAIGKWLDVNGEAIYGTRPWDVFGEGPNRFAASSFADSTPPVFTGQDIRFTRKGNELYAIFLAWPGSQATITSLGAKTPIPLSGAIGRIQLLGSDTDLSWNQTADGLVVNLPSFPPDTADYAYVLKISGLRLSGIRPDPNGVLRLSCGQADFGQSALTQSNVQRYRYGLVDSCYFNSKEESASWTAHFTTPGDYAVTVEASAAAGNTALQMTGCNGQLLNVSVPATGAWDQFTTTATAYLNVPVAEDCAFTLRPYGPMNLVHVDFRPIVLPRADGSLSLAPSAATLNGTALRVETRWGAEDIGYWNDGRESASWRVHFPAAGNYIVTAGVADGADPATATIDVGAQPALGSLVLNVANTGGWGQPVGFAAGPIAIPAPGDYDVSVRASETTSWHPVNLFYLKLTPQTASSGQ